MEVFECFNLAFPPFISTSIYQFIIVAVFIRENDIIKIAIAYTLKKLNLLQFFWGNCIPRTEEEK